MFNVGDDVTVTRGEYKGISGKIVECYRAHYLIIIVHVAPYGMDDTTEIIKVKKGYLATF